MGEFVDVGERVFGETYEETRAGGAREGGGEVDARWNADSAASGKILVSATRLTKTTTQVRQLRNWAQRWERRVDWNKTGLITLFGPVLFGVGWLLWLGSPGNYFALPVDGQNEGTDVVEDWHEDTSRDVLERSAAAGVELVLVVTGHPERAVRTDDSGIATIRMNVTSSAWAYTEGIRGPPTVEAAARRLARTITGEIRAPSLNASARCGISMVLIDRLAAEVATADGCAWRARVLDSVGRGVEGAVLAIVGHHGGGGAGTFADVEPPELRSAILAHAGPSRAQRDGVIDRVTTSARGEAELRFACRAPAGEVAVDVRHLDYVHTRPATHRHSSATERLGDIRLAALGDAGSRPRRGR